MLSSLTGKKFFSTPLPAWLAERGKVYQRWQSSLTVVAAWLGLVLATITPPHGNGIVICWIKRSSGIDCPGCGLTRSLSCGLRGMFTESFHYHPFGLVILVLFLFTAVISLMPSARKQVSTCMEARPVLFNTLYLAFVVSFVTFGAVRALIEIVQHVLGS